MGEEKPSVRAAAKKLESSEETPESPNAPESARSWFRRPDRAGLLIAGAVLAACGGLVLYGVLDGGDDDKRSAHPQTPTAPVTYEVTGTGTADLTFQARSESGKATVVRGAHLPWRTSVDVPVGHDPVISIVLGEDGGTARCALAIRGRHVQSATASGSFGRATCSGALPSAGGETRG
ncbi:hypothetical protein [Streptomyces sp. Ru71]|uniref:hypothetical protein n=1 Tax=Streptomyces sp. Ru71 TaxID=2080746 RepID=UPI002156114B|nr:hypothetical protein [Streptomyces sp. Ru71]